MRYFISGLVVVMFCLMSANQSVANDRISVLFIGNSLINTGATKVFEELAKKQGLMLDVVIHSPSATSFEDHAQNQALQRIIWSRDWDYVVLHEQSQKSAWPDHQLTSRVHAPARKLVETIRYKNDRAQIFFMITMARKNGDPQNVEILPVLATYEGMQQRVNYTYYKLAVDNAAFVAPVGEVWQSLRRDYPNIELYSDLVHANANGAYVTGCTLFSSLFCGSCQALKTSVNVTKQVREVITSLTNGAVREQCSG